MRDFKIEQARSASLIWNHKYDFKPNFYNVKFSYYFITVHLFWNRKFSRSNTGLVNLSIGPALAGL